MEPPSVADDTLPIFYVGQHETQRVVPVTSQVLRQAQDCNYDMLTAPITNLHFQSRVLALHKNHLQELRGNNDRGSSAPIVHSLSSLDTSLGPGETISHTLGVISPWIDLCSPDPLVYNISRQVLELEIAFAAFCGLGNVIITGPRLHYGQLHGDGVMQYALAIQQALVLSNYLQIEIKLPMLDHTDADTYAPSDTLGYRAREEFLGIREAKRKADLFGTWDAWNIIRTVCKYNSRLFVALSIPRYLPPASIQSRWHSEPIRILCLDAKTFHKNEKYYLPVLSKPQQALVTKFMRLRNPPWLLLCDIGPIPGLDNHEAIFPRADGFTSPGSVYDIENSPTPTEAAQSEHNKSRKKRKDDPTPHLSYIRYLQRKQPTRTEAERYGAGYQDYLQAPLQPLADNLESVTYEVFEKDLIKYDLYEKAITQALKDWSSQGKKASGTHNRVVVAVCGAGRGPLVTRALSASEAANVEIELWALEKNPNAYVLLQRHNQNTWNSKVHLVQSDMRTWKGPLRQQQHSQPSPTIAPQTGSEDGSCEETYHDAIGPICSSSNAATQQTQEHIPIDILISELLGSFADNELSPECLDGILPLLNPTHGISIPSSYTAYVTPLAAPKLHADILSRTANDPNAPNTPYVVMLHAVDYLSTTLPPPAPSPSSPEGDTTSPEGNTTCLVSDIPVPVILPVWSFHHTSSPAAIPASAQNTHNTRHSRLTFRLRHRGVIHGLAGYFEADLYPGVGLSTNPSTMESRSAEMMSWFPIFFPLKTPLYTPDNAELSVSISRCTDNRKVWYDWVVESWGLNNLIGGEKIRIRLGGGEVGSSKVGLGGCVM